MGRSETADGDRAFLWEAGTGMQDLGLLPGGTGTSSAAAINNAGQVVGDSHGGSATFGFIWESGTGMTSLGTLGAYPWSGSSAADINAAGQVTGYTASPDGRRAFVWEEGAGMTSLGGIPGVPTAQDGRSVNTSTGAAINDAGMVAGYGATRSTDMAVVWDGPSGDQVVPNAAEVWYARGADVNALSQVVGSAAGLEWTQAFLWDPLTGMQLLGALSGSDPMDSHAAAVNDFGQVVGHSTIGFVDRAFLWTEAGGMTDLNALIDGGGVLNAALDISDAGHIVGWGVAEGTDWLQAFLLTPEELNPVAPVSAVEDSVPLPAGAALLSVALAGLALSRRPVPRPAD